MKRYDTIYLISQSPIAHGIYDTPTEVKTQVFCEVQSVGMNETYTMLNHHLRAEYVFVLAIEDEYTQVSECKVVEYKGKRYNITRLANDTYGKIKLVCSSNIRDRG